MTQHQLDERVRAVRELTSLFRLERYIYVGIIVVCSLVLLIAIGIALSQGELRASEISAIFGSGGAISVMTGRLMHMWNRAVNLLDSQHAN